MTEIILSDKTVGSTYDLIFPIKRDGVIWSGIESVTLEFSLPPTQTTEGLTFNRVATLLDDSLGKWHYIILTTDLTLPGFWSIAVEAIEGAIQITYNKYIQFRVR